MTEFQIGDKVRVTASAEQCSYIAAPKTTSGITGVVVGFVTPLNIDVQFENSHEGSDVWNYVDDMLEKIDG